jgi:hypothetical protein
VSVESLDSSTGELVALTLSAAQAASYMDSYESVCLRILRPDDIQRIAGREFIKRSGWRKLGVWAQVSAEILSATEVRDEAGKLQRARYKVRASAPNGRYMDGIGVCDRSERAFTKPEHDIPATAHTRAVNRAFADLFGLGAVSAEEVDQVALSPSPGSPKAPPPPRERSVEVSVDPAAHDLAARVDTLDAAERRVFKEWQESHNIKGNSRAVLRAIGRKLDEIEAARSISHYDPDATSPFD